MKIDFHWKSLEQAENIIHAQVSKARCAGKVDHLELVVGHGVIKERLLEILKDYDLEPHVDVANDGQINVTVE